MRSVLIHVQHLLGIGHLMRARLLAEALAARDFDVHLVSGGMPIGGRLPRGVRTVQLPPIRVSDASFTPLRDADFNPIDDAYRARRRDLLLAAYEAARPSAVLFETFPFGRRALRFELVPLLERIEAARPRPLVIASIREILQRQPKAEREREMLGWAARWFDAVLVHGDRRFARFEDSFAFADELAPPVHYTGFVLGGDAVARADREERRTEVVVSAGGGGVGIELLATALAAQAHSRFRDLTWRILAGPNITEAGFTRLQRATGPQAVVERSRVDFAALLRTAFVSVSQAGYNTTLDVVTSGARPVIVPFTGNGETEQRERGARLRDLGLAVVLDDRGLTPEALARAIDDAGTRTSFGRWEFDSDGAARTAALVDELLRSGVAHRADPLVLN
jgi:predicted glycosyltransferase